MNIAVIPARGGSKRIARKNIKKFYGKPIITWPIEVLKNCKIFDRIIISTDDIEIAEITQDCGGEVPFMRPPEISDDITGTADVMSHAVNWMHEKGLEPDAVCCIYPTSVFLKVIDLKKGLKALNSGDWQYAISTTDFHYPIFRSFMKNKNGGIEMVFPEYFKSRSQDLPEAIHDAAQFYWGRPDAWLNKLKLFDAHTFPVRIPNFRVKDIDTEQDWSSAELLFKMIKKGKS